MTRLLLILILLTGVIAQGADKYIRAGATAGTKTGASWANAYTNFPASGDWTRGDTYYVAVGTYPAAWPGHILDATASGTTVTTIKKATIANNSGDSGWDNSYAGQAVIDGNIGLVTDYWLIDGVTRDETNWRSNVYGFRMDGSFFWREDWFGGDDIGDNVTIQYVDVGGTASETFDEGHPDEGFYFTTVGTPTQANVTNVTIARCHVHNVDVPFQMTANNGATIEYCHIGPSWSKEAIRGQVTAKNITIRFNVFLNASQIVAADVPLYPDGPGRVGCTAQVGIWDAYNTNATGNFDGVEIYGNIFATTLTKDAVYTTDALVLIGSEETPPISNNSKVYNNTFVGFETNKSGIKVPGGSGNEARNNLWYDVGPVPAIAANSSSFNSNYVSSPFIDYAAGDYRLTAPTISGTTLSSPYDTDITGASRTNWSLGALEYGSVFGAIYDPTPEAQTTPILNVGSFFIR